MKKFTCILALSLCALFLLVIEAGANTYIFQTTALTYLDHSRYYMWGIDWEVPTGETVVGANLSISNLENFDTAEHHFYAHLLDYAPGGTTSRHDSYGDSEFTDQFTHSWLENEFLFDESDVPLGSAKNIDYDFDSNELSLLIEYNDDDASSYWDWARFGLGFDPDCHFDNNGMTFTITTTTPGDAVPEPATMFLLGTGLLGFVGIRRKIKKS